MPDIDRFRWTAHECARKDEPEGEAEHEYDDGGPEIEGSQLYDVG